MKAKNESKKNGSNHDRQLFAAMAMQGIVVGIPGLISTAAGRETIAKDAYAMADQMLVEESDEGGSATG